MLSEKIVPVVWIAEHDLYVGMRKKKNIAYLGICGESKRICKLGAIMHVMIIRDIYITDGKCEEATRCIDLDCPLNNTTLESFCRGTGFSMRKLKKIEPRFNNRETLDCNLGPEGLRDFSSLVEGRERGGLIVREHKTMKNYQVMQDEEII